MAYLSLYPGASRWAGRGRSAETLLNYALIVFGFYVLIAGTYVSSPVPLSSDAINHLADCLLRAQTSIKSIIIDYTGQEVFTCVSNGV